MKRLFLLLCLIPLSLMAQSKSSSKTKSTNESSQIAHYIPGILAYPNPGDAIIHVEWVSAYQGNVQITLSDLTGRTLGKLDVDKLESHFDNELDASLVPKGTYILTVKEGDLVRRARWVKQ